MSRSGIEDDDINAWQAIPVLAKGLPNQALQPVTAGSQATVLLRYREAKSWFGRPVATKQNDKVLVPAALWSIEYPTE